jgi:hypothetical protein
MPKRRFPASWRADKNARCAYIVREVNGEALVYLYSRDSEAEAMRAKVLTPGRSPIASVLPGPACTLIFGQRVVEGDLLVPEFLGKRDQFSGHLEVPGFETLKSLVISVQMSCANGER